MSGEGLPDFSAIDNMFIDIDNAIIREAAKIKAESIAMRREEVLEAFVAKYGFEPERFCMIVEHTPTGTKERVLRLSDEDIEKARVSLFKSPWQPIDTAPKDGTAILACHEELHEAAIVVWRYDAWVIAARTGDIVFDPTHWMPIPELPK